VVVCCFSSAWCSAHPPWSSSLTVRVFCYLSSAIVGSLSDGLVFGSVESLRRRLEHHLASTVVGAIASHLLVPSLDGLFCFVVCLGGSVVLVFYFCWFAR
jgi:hypothetical protein